MTDVPAHPRPWWHDIRWITALVVAALVGSIVWGLFGPEPRIVVSRETTFITVPLRPDGLPDYATHVLDLMGRGTPPEENAAVAVLHATWPMGLDEAQLAATCTALGIPATPPEVAPLVEPDHETELNALVARQLPALDLVVEATERPRYELPPADLLRAGPEDTLLGAGLPEIQSTRGVARVLFARAMHRVGEGRTAAAWRDIRALHRFGRLLAPADRGSFLVTQLVSVAIGASANQATLALLDTAGLPSEELAAIRRDLDALPERADATAGLVMERLGGLDMIVNLSRMPRGRRMDAVGWGADDLRLPLSTSLDMNVVLRGVNAALDRLDAIARMPDRAARRDAFEDLDRELAARLIPPTGWRRAARVLRIGTSRGARSEDVAIWFAALFAPSMKAGVDALERSRTEFELVRLAAALAEWRARSGAAGPSYPDRLDALVPNLLPGLPPDPCSGASFRYERRGDGYLLYSVGTNGVDDGGTSGEVRAGEWLAEGEEAANGDVLADLVVRMPRPRRGIPPRR